MTLNTIAFACLVSVFSFSAPSSEKVSSLSNPAKWSKGDIEKFKAECLGLKEIQELGKLGVQLCDCILDKSQKNYPTYDVANTDGEGMKKIGESCAEEVTSTMNAPAKGDSKKGKWSNADKKIFLDDCNGVKEVKDLGKLGNELCDCMLKKSEMTFSNFKEADSDEQGMETIGLSCADEVVGKKKK
jgi:hypothetical protein